MTVRAGCGKFIFKISDFLLYNHSFVKLANLATLSKTKIIFFIQIDVRVYIYLHNKCIINVAISINLTSHLALTLLKAMLNCR